MKAVLMLIFMLELHIFADYHLQGILGRMKQKRWWGKQQDFDRTIRYGLSDYKVALTTHCIEWSFCICSPMIFCGWERMNGDFSWDGFKLLATLVVLLIVNSLFHYAADDMKANDKSLTLLQDQELHLAQILMSWLLWTVICGW